MKMSGRYCGYCNTRVLAQKQAPNHVLHLLLTFTSCGLWSLIWLLLAAASYGRYKCPRCGGDC